MKKLLYYTILATTVLCGCDSSNKSSNNQLAPETPLPTVIATTPASDPRLKRASEIVRDRFNQQFRSAKIGFVSENKKWNPQYQISEITERYIQVKNNGFIYTLLPVTDADRLNGIEYRVRFKLDSGPHRACMGSNGWTQWSDLDPLGWSAELSKEGETWHCNFDKYAGEDFAAPSSDVTP